MRIASPARATVNSAVAQDRKLASLDEEHLVVPKGPIGKFSILGKPHVAPLSCVEPAFVIARVSSKPGTSSLQGWSRSVSSFTFVLSDMVSSSRRLSVCDNTD